MLVTKCHEMFSERKGDHKAHRKTICQEATVMLDGVRRAMDDISDANRCAADRHVRIRATTGECLSYGRTHAHSQMIPDEHTGVRVGPDCRSIAQGRSHGTDIYQDPRGRDCVQLEVRQNHRFGCSGGGRHSHHYSRRSPIYPFHVRQPRNDYTATILFLGTLRLEASCMPPFMHISGSVEFSTCRLVPPSIDAPIVSTCATRTRTHPTYGGPSCNQWDGQYLQRGTHGVWPGPGASTPS
jgi:hypothetical protein